MFATLTVRMRLGNFPQHPSMSASSFRIDVVAVTSGGVRVVKLSPCVASVHRGGVNLGSLNAVGASEWALNARYGSIESGGYLD